MTVTNTITMIYRRAQSGMLLTGLLLVAHAAFAQSWTHVASACVPDESSTGLYTFTNGSVTFTAAAPAGSAIKLRCNVTSPLDFTIAGSPATWNQLHVGYQDAAGGQIQVQLVRIAKANGAAFVMANLVSAAGGPVVGTAAIGGAFDFTLNEYFVAINLTRAAGAPLPQVWYVGID